METVDMRTEKEKAAERSEKVKQKISEVTAFVKDNKILIPFGIAMINGSAKIAKAMIQSHAVNKEIDFKERHIYDRSMGRYVELKRPLSSTQALEIESRKENGERLYVILESMNLLKK